MSTQLDATLESNFSTMTTRELREWLQEIELSAQDAWTNSELASLRADRDKVRAEIDRRSRKPAKVKCEQRCADCGEPGVLTGHQECQYPQDH